MVLSLYFVKKTEEMKKSELTFYKILIAIVYFALAALVVIAFFI